jgi:Rrf2 family transcriptional regulator, iron-sulfur cluster assembly transcription factor
MVRNKAVSYALMAMVDIAERAAGEPPTEVQAADVATRLGLPTAYTAKVLSSLARAALLRSDRGPRGGFQLARDAKSITVFDILQAVGAWSSGDLAFSPTASPKLRRVLDEALVRAMSKAQEVLQDVRLSDLLEQPAPVGAGV